MLKSPRMTALAISLLGATALVTLMAQELPETDSPAPDAGPVMTVERLVELLLRVDEEATNEGNRWLFTVAEVRMMMVVDPTNDRMRLMTPIREARSLTLEELTRLMQANFDTALDARYGLAGDVLWGTFIHPLGTLSDEEFLVAIGQVANVAITYGESYSSGVLMFGGGDTGQRQRDLIEQLRKKNRI